MKRGLILAAVLVAATAGTASAANITQNTNVGTVYTTNHVEDTTWGDEMGGMTVVATLVRQDNTTFQLNGVWTDVGAGLGGIIQWVAPLDDDDTFRLGIWGDTYWQGFWNLKFDFDSENYRLGSLSFDGRPGNTVFDTRFNGNNGTPGSDAGRNFSGFDDWNGNITATYSNAVKLGPAAPVGDLYTNFLLYFGSGNWNSALRQNRNHESYSFTLDTDTATTLQQTAVPEPGSMILLGTGLAGLASRLRRKKAA